MPYNHLCDIIFCRFAAPQTEFLLCTLYFGKNGLNLTIIGFSMISATDYMWEIGLYLDLSSTSPSLCSGVMLSLIDFETTSVSNIKLIRWLSGLSRYSTPTFSTFHGISSIPAHFLFFRPKTIFLTSFRSMR